MATKHGTELETNSAAIGARSDCQLCSLVNLNAEATSDGIDPLTAASDHMMLTFGDDHLYRKGGDFRSNALAWGCYGNRWKVPVRAVDPKGAPGCAHYNEMKDQQMWFFRRLCVAKLMLKAFQDDRSPIVQELGMKSPPKWIFHIDGDAIVFNGGTPLSALTQQWQGKELIFYERYHSAEIVAGNYALHVSPVSEKFLGDWEALHAEADFWYSNWDNGALHIALLQHLRDELEDPAGFQQGTAEAMPQLQSNEVEHVRKTWHKSTDIPTYDRFVAAAKLMLGRKRVYKDVLIQRRGHGFCADSSLNGVGLAQLSGKLASRFLCLHGTKHTPGDLIAAVGRECTEAVETCQASLLSCSSKPKVSEELLVHGIRTYKETMHRMSLGRVDDVGACWPDCPADIPEDMWSHLKEGLRKNAECLFPAWDRGGSICF